MIIFGAVEFSAARARVAKLLGDRVTVRCASDVATDKLFSDADEVIVDWPGRYLSERLPRPLTPRDAICVLTHDPKFDIPAIMEALATDMGSRRTRAERDARLRQAGVSDNARARVMSPIGIDQRARTLEETAISICAELIRVRRARTGTSLRDVDSPIHPRSFIDRQKQRDRGGS